MVKDPQEIQAPRLTREQYENLENALSSTDIPLDEYLYYLHHPDPIVIDMALTHSDPLQLLESQEQIAHLFKVIEETQHLDNYMYTPHSATAKILCIALKEGRNDENTFINILKTLATHSSPKVRAKVYESLCFDFGYCKKRSNGENEINTYSKKCIQGLLDLVTTSFYDPDPEVRRSAAALFSTLLCQGIFEKPREVILKYLQSDIPDDIKGLFALPAITILRTIYTPQQILDMYKEEMNPEIAFHMTTFLTNCEEDFFNSDPEAQQYFWRIITSPQYGTFVRNWALHRAAKRYNSTNKNFVRCVLDNLEDDDPEVRSVALYYYILLIEDVNKRAAKT